MSNSTSLELGHPKSETALDDRVDSDHRMVGLFAIRPGILVFAPRMAKWILSVYLVVWIASLVGVSVGEAAGLPVPPIAREAGMDLLSLYIPVVLLSVFVLLFLTRKRESVEWAEVFGKVNRNRAAVEAAAVAGYLLVTQLVLGQVAGIGLHFPGPVEYVFEHTVNGTGNGTDGGSNATLVVVPGNRNSEDVWIWALVNTLVYTVLPTVYLCCFTSFSVSKMMSTLKWYVIIP